MKPTIGIVVCGFMDNRQFVTNSYIQSIRYSGGLPLILPLVRSDALLEQYTGLCSGFLFCGGGDITPLLFGQEPQNGNGHTSITVDLFQIRLMKKILASGKPVLAICRGMQVLSVACGGTIWQDMSLIPGDTLDHMQKSASRADVSHRIRTERGSLIRRCAGPSIFVNSFHHQSVNTPGKGVAVTARAPDGTIEAIEVQGHPFAAGVQWHPECMYRTSREMRALFQEFVARSLTS
ncbi:MAG TPA: gamma-glutamyl-gamma-aminobutyrate hydrolase family protein [Candidatus Mediterraneibacter avicola]|nr:gamma-glutamyl-gamma-aminobutyrate hydrolase family protein [Candidatus Mediterraneibacter avicola]